MSDPTPRAPLHTWLADPPDDSVDRAIDRMRRMRDVKHVAIMPDVHLGQGVCIGSVIATETLIYPSAVGGDIGCGMLAVAFDADASAVTRQGNERRLLEALRHMIPLKHQPKPRRVTWFDLARLRDPQLDAIKRDAGPLKLGTLGGGNHFVELQRDVADGRLWLMIHSGSRHLGQAIRDRYVRAAEGRSFSLDYLDGRSDVGRAYLHDAGWARAYAELNRQAMMFAAAIAVRRVIGADPQLETYIRTDHNHVRRERHGGRWLWIHRKGAAPAEKGRLLVIPGSMGAASYHAVGRGCDRALRSSSHGAGRVRSRSQARRDITAAALRRQMDGVAFDTRRARALVEEAPDAYRDIERVMRAQRELVSIHRRLMPVLAYKG